MMITVLESLPLILGLILELLRPSYRIFYNQLMVKTYIKRATSLIVYRIIFESF